MEVTKQKKVFISGKITGDPNYREKFDKAEKELTEQGHLVMNPSVFPEGFRWEDYMKITRSGSPDVRDSAAYATAMPLLLP